MSGAVRLEKAGKPVAYIVTDNFYHDAVSATEDNGMPGLRIIGVPAAVYYKQRITRQAITLVAVEALDSIVDALTRLPEGNEESPAVGQTKATGNTGTLGAMGALVFSAPTYEEALEDFNQQFLDNHWGGGLPLIPPTPQSVKWMLGGTRRSPQEIIGKVAPKDGLATVEKIAVNAVMAGARPEYMPVIIAIMEAVTDSRFDLLHMTASTGSFSLQIIVNGPVAERIGMNSGIGLMGYGWRANNTIGHAVRLCLINLGHAWPAENDMALVGRPSSHTCQVFAENEAQSPWQPYHVSRGFSKQSDCVTVATSTCLSSPDGTFVLGGGAVEPWTPQEILKKMTTAIDRGRLHMAVWKHGSAISSPPRFVFVIHPELAVELNNLGYDQRSLGRYLFEQTRIPYDDLNTAELESGQRRLQEGEIPPESVALYQASLQPGGRVPLLLRPEDCHIFVAGGIPGYTFVTSYFSVPPYAETAIMTKEIDPV